MKKLKSRSILKALTAALLIVGALPCLTGCKPEQGSPPSQPAKPGLQAPVSAEKTSFKEVTAQLDPGGSLYLYLSTEQFLDGLAAKAGTWNSLLTNLPGLDEDKRQHVTQAFTLVTNFIASSGVEDVSGLGMSSIARETNFYHSKAVLHHYAGRGNGFLWNVLGQKAHRLDSLNLLPASTVLANFTDLDASLLWSAIQKQAGAAGVPQADEMLSAFPAKFEELTGLKWDKMLASLGGEVGFAVTLDDAKVIPIPMGGDGDPVQIPEPGLLLVAKVKDETIFNRISEAMARNGGQQIVKVDKPGVKMRTWPLPFPLPIQLRPTAAAVDGYLFIASTDALINEVLAAQSGQKPGLKSIDEFQRLAKDTPAQGNGFTFTSARFGRVMSKVQQGVLQNNPLAKADWAQSLLASRVPSISYGVIANTEEGWLAVMNGNQHPGKIVAVGTAVPAGILAAVAIPNFVKARSTSQKNACINNLRQIDGAKQQWALENKRLETDVPTAKDIAPYLRNSTLPTCPAGGAYTINRVGAVPECGVSGHTLGQ